MAVDIKTLRIGSHVEYEGKRVRICSLKTNMANYDEGKGKPRCFGSSLAYYKRMQPILITPELLTELGFVNTSCTRRIVYTKGSEYEDSWIDFRNLKDRWEIFVSKDNWDGRIVCRYLHEAEAFLALHGVELIKD